MKQHKIPIFDIDGDFNEEEDLVYFNCPITGINTFGPDWTEDNYPEELIYYTMSLFPDCEYIREDLRNIIEKIENSTNEIDPDFDRFDFICEYLETKSPKDKDYFVLFVSHPEDGDGAVIIYVYEGIYENIVSKDIAIEAFTKRMLSSGPPQIISKEEQGGASTVGVFNIPDED